MIRAPIRAVLIFVSCSVVGYIYSIFTRPQERPVDPVLPAYGSAFEDLCKSYVADLSFSPASRFVVFEQGIPSATSAVHTGRRVAVVDLSCAMDSPRDDRCVTQLQALESVRAISWSEDEKSLFAIENKNNLIRVEFSGTYPPHSGHVAERVSVDRGLGLAYASSGTTTANTANEQIQQMTGHAAAALRHKLPDDLPYGIFADRSGAIGSIVRTADDMHIALVSSTTRTVSDVMIAQAPSARLMREGTSGHPEGLVFFDTGFARAEQGSKSSPMTLPPFARMVSLAHGDGVAGYHTKFEVSLGPQVAHGSTIVSELAERAFGDAGFYLKGLTVDAAGNYAYVAQDMHHRQRIGWKNAGAKFQFDCPSSPYPGIGTAAGKIELRQVSLGEAGRPLFALLATQDRPRGLVVFHGGGPGSSIDDMASYSIRQYLQLGWSVLAVNSSGSIASGLEISRRLASEGLAAAFVNDARSVARYLRTRPESEQTILHGESLGGLAATALNGQLERAHRLVLVAPLLKHQSPYEWAEKNASLMSGAVSPPYQERFEAAMLGATLGQTSSLQPQLDSILALKRPATSTLFVFAEADPLSQSQHLPKFWAKSATIFKVGGGHGLVTAQSELWPALDAWLQDRKPE